MKYVYLLSAGIALSGVAHAELDSPGFSGELSLLAGYGSEKNNLSTENKKAKADSAGSTESKSMVVPLGEMRYTFGQDNDQQVYAGTSRSDIVQGVFALEIGYAFEFDGESVLSFGYLPTVASGDVWEDPYKFDGNRKKTEKSGNAYRIQYENVLDTGLSLDFAYYDQEIDDEKSASTLSSSQQKKMRRGGNGYLISIENMLPVSNSSFIKPSLSFENFNADGSAMSYKQYGASFGYLKQIKQHAISLNGEYKYKKFDGSNPVFDKTQKNDSLGFTAAYEYENVFGWENWGFNALATYENTSSNITFYDTNEYLFALGMSRKF